MRVKVYVKKSLFLPKKAYFHIKFIHKDSQQNSDKNIPSRLYKKPANYAKKLEIEDSDKKPKNEDEKIENIKKPKISSSSEKHNNEIVNLEELKNNEKKTYKIMLMGGGRLAEYKKVFF